MSGADIYSRNIAITTDELLNKNLNQSMRALRLLCSCPSIHLLGESDLEIFSHLCKLFITAPQRVTLKSNLRYAVLRTPKPFFALATPYNASTEWITFLSNVQPLYTTPTRPLHLPHISSSQWLKVHQSAKPTNIDGTITHFSPFLSPKGLPSLQWKTVPLEPLSLIPVTTSFDSPISHALFRYK